MEHGSWSHAGHGLHRARVCMHGSPSNVQRREHEQDSGKRFNNARLKQRYHCKSDDAIDVPVHMLCTCKVYQLRTRYCTTCIGARHLKSWRVSFTVEPPPLHPCCGATCHHPPPPHGHVHLSRAPRLQSAFAARPRCNSPARQRRLPGS